MKFSIVMPVYNGEKYISNSIQSIVNQNYKDWEIIIIDDGSTDKSSSIIREYADNDNRIRYYWQENAGVSCARNKALDLFQGDYVIFVDADDELHPQALKTVADYLEKYSVDIVVYNASRSDFNAEKMIPFTIPLDSKPLLINSEELKIKNIYSALLSDASFGFVWNYAVRTSVIKKHSFREDIIICEDLLFDIEMYTDAETILCIPDYLYYYRDNPDGCVNNFNYKKIEDLKKIFEIRKALIDKYKLKGNYDLIVKSFCGNILYAYLSFIQNSKLCREYIIYVKKDSFIMDRFKELSAVSLPKTYPSIKYIFGNVLERSFMRICILLRKKVKKLIKR